MPPPHRDRCCGEPKDPCPAGSWLSPPVSFAKGSGRTRASQLGLGGGWKALGEEDKVHHVHCAEEQTEAGGDSQTGRGGASPRILAADPSRAPSCSFPALLCPLPATCLSPTPRLSSRLLGPKPRRAPKPPPMTPTAQNPARIQRAYPHANPLACLDTLSWASSPPAPHTRPEACPHPTHPGPPALPRWRCSLHLEGAFPRLCDFLGLFPPSTNQSSGHRSRQGFGRPLWASAAS